MEGKSKLRPSDYVHLHNHTQYSLLDGLTKVPALLTRVKEMGMDAVAITDHGTMSGTIEFYTSARANGVKPIVGMEAYVAPRAYTDKDSAHDRQYFHLTILAMNAEGYKNLMRLSSIANLEGFYYRPRIDRELLKKYNPGLIILSGCIGGEISDALRQDQYDIAKKAAKWFKDVFQDRYYIELQDHGHQDHPTAWDEQNKVNAGLLKIAKELDIPAVVTCDAHYLNHEDQEAHEILLCVQTGAFLTDANRFSLKDFELHVADPVDIIKRWGKDHPDLITNTRKIAERCNLEIDLGNILIPKFPTPQNENEKTLLEKQVWSGLAWRYGGLSRIRAKKLSNDECKKTLSKDIIERANYELKVVNSMGFNGYYLIVADFINWGKERGIVFGPGRGSAAGSIMSYALRITEIDPIKYDLLFERFLNPDRVSMPDMDIDIQDSRRDEVINYCVEKYGRDRVANIVTFGRMAARNSVRDVARVLQVPYAEADRLAKMLPPPIQGRHIPLEQSLQENSEIKAEYNSSEQSARVFELAMKLEGTIRSHGVHAAGVVIAPDDIVNYSPLEIAQKGAITTQYSMGPIMDDIGLLKMDFLGLSNLTTIKNALRIIKKVAGKEIDLLSIPLDDKKTFDLLRRGETTGVFQLESSGMKRYLKELKPTQFEDIIAMGALYRPGPMSEIPRFIEGKNNPASVSYLHKSIEPILRDTYGVMVYQEQIIKLLQMVAGYTAGEADLVRKAIGKKNRSIMAAEEPKFIEGCMKQGLTRDGAKKLWAQIQPFADYSFNKAHATCYAQISYWTAYLKANFPSAFMAALMTSDYDDTDRLAIEISECKHRGIEVLPPDINESFHEFGVVQGTDKIRFGLDAVKNVGHGAVEEILKGRETAGGHFDSLEDFCKHVNARVVNRKSMESLVKAGAFDAFGERGHLLNNLDNILNLANRIQKDVLSGQVDLFGESDSASHMAMQLVLDENGPTYPPHEQLTWERELLGLYLSHNPLSDYETLLANETTPIASLSSEATGHSVTVGGLITAVREITTKTGSKMAFVRMEDLSGEMELVFFPKPYAKTAEVVKQDNILLARGKVGSGRAQDEGSELKVMVDEAQVVSLEDARSYVEHSKSFINAVSTRRQAKLKKVPPKVEAKQRLYIRVEDSSNKNLLISLKEKLDGYQGQTEVVLVTGPTDSKQVIKLPQAIDVNEESLRDLANIFGSTNVVVR